jgi:hypothetical protein
LLSAARRDGSGSAPTPSDLFSVSSHGWVSYVVGEDRNSQHALHLYCGDQEIEVSGEWIGFYEEILRRKTFAGSDALSFNDQTRSWEEVLPHLEVLLQIGVLRRASPPRRVV